MCKDAQQNRSLQGELQEEHSLNSNAMEDTICKYNQSGFCKFRKTCDKRHDNEICNNITNCKETQCTKRHPKKCKRFNENGKCFYKEECAYLHDDVTSNQNKLNEMMSLCVIKHENEIKELTKDVKRLEDVLKNMTVHIETLVKALQSSQQSENRNYPKTQDNDNENKDPETEIVFRCEQCSFYCKKEVTLKKHVNTKHDRELQDVQLQDSEKTCKFHCDQCEYSCASKKSLKKHAVNEHKVQNNFPCVECGKDFNTKNNLEEHMIEHHKIYPEVDDAELDEWIAKARGMQ